MAAEFSQAAFQLQGTREEQQDAFGYGNLARGETDSGTALVAVVADGVGGHSHGRVASHLAIRTFLRAVQVQHDQREIQKALLFALNKANQSVLELGKAETMQDKSCGTTLTAAVVETQARLLHWIGVGDSRLYLIRGERLIQITVDGNYATYLKKVEMWAEPAEEPMQTGEQTPEDTLSALTSYLGKKNLEGMDRNIRPFRLQAGDWCLICSDGLYNALTPAEIMACLGDSPESACHRLQAMLAEKNLASLDNTTVLIFGYGSRPEPKPLPIITPPPVAEPSPPPQPQAAGFWQKWSRTLSNKP